MSRKPEWGRVGPTREQWDLLASGWSVLEPYGLNESHIQQVAQWLRPPVLVVGAGQGLLVSACQSLGLEPVRGIDFSPQMVELARQRRGLEIHLGDATDMPFPMQAFRSIICASGTVPPVHSVQGEEIARELVRVSRPDATVLLAFFLPDKRSRKQIAALGCYDGRAMRYDRIVQLWVARKNMRQQATLVADWSGSGGDESLTLLESSSDRLNSWFAMFDAFRTQVQDVDPQSCRALTDAHIADCFAWRLEGLAEPVLPAPWQHSPWFERTQFYDAATLLQCFLLSTKQQFT